MRKPLVLILAFLFLTSLQYAQSQRIPKARPVQKSEDQKEKAEKKPGFFKRVFGKKEVKPEPAPAPTEPVKPKPRPRAKPRASTPPAAVAEQPESPAVSEPTPKPDSQKKPKPGVDAPKKPEVSEYEGMSEMQKYKAVRSKALKDEKIKALAAKLESTVEEDQAAVAASEYNGALFRKIRQIEPSLDAYVDRIEASMQKRLKLERANR